MARQITWSYHTEYTNGYVNPTYTWRALQSIFDFVSEYLDIQYVNVPPGKGRVQIIQSRTQISTPGAWMWTKPGFKTYISPVVNYGKNSYLCAKTTIHEMFHWVNMGHLGGTVALMTPNGGTCHNITQQDAPYMAPYAWRSDRRPWNEPELLLQRFPYAAMAGAVLPTNRLVDTPHFNMMESIRQNYSAEELAVFQQPYRCCHQKTPWHVRLKSVFSKQEAP